MRLERPELKKCPANYVPLTPVSFLARAASFFGERTAVVHGTRRLTYRDLYARSRQLAHALTKAGVRRGDTVAIVAPNVPAMLEAHYGVPMLGAVLNQYSRRSISWQRDMILWRLMPLALPCCTRAGRTSVISRWLTKNWARLHRSTLSISDISLEFPAPEGYLGIQS